MRDAKNFFLKLLDAQDKSVDEAIFFTLLGASAIVIYGFIQVCFYHADFKISDFGEAFTYLFGGQGIHAVGKGIQNLTKQPPPTPEEVQK